MGLKFQQKEMKINKICLAYMQIVIKAKETNEPKGKNIQQGRENCNFKLGGQRRIHQKTDMNKDLKVESKL